MKKLLLAPLLAGTLLAGTVISMSNLNVINLLINGSDYASGGSGEAFDVVGEENQGDAPLPQGQISDEALESLQSGLLGNGGEGRLNLLWLLQNAKDPDKESYAYQLLSAYAKLENGEYNNLPYHISPEAIAGSHYNETKLASFAVPSTSGYGKATSGILGKTINGKKITLENAKKEDILGNAPQTGSVWVDKASGGGDGYPDGPFQIIQGKQSDTNADKNRTDGKYDLYNFIDASNVVDSKYSPIAQKYAEAGSTPDARAIQMLSAITHNRGDSGVGWMLFGLPYDLHGGVGKYLKHSTIASFTPKELEIAANFPKNLLKWFDASNIPLEQVAGNGNGQGIGTLLVLANGGFLDIPLQKTSEKNIKALSNDVITKIFPGQTNSTIVNHINSKYVKNPWDVLGVSKAEYSKVYGGSYSNYEVPYSTSEGYYRNTLFYIDKNITSDNYKAGNHVVVQAMEGIALGYMMDTGLTGTYTILQIAIEAGIKSLTDGTIVDPSNPASFYKSNGGGNEGGGNDTYNPAGAATGNFGKFLDGLGLTGKLSVTQQAQIKAMYEVSGGPYCQTGVESYCQYKYARGTIMKDGRVVMDCSAFATIGLFMDPSNRKFESTATIKEGTWLRSTKKTATVDGKSYPVKVVQIDSNGKAMPESSKFNFTHTKKDYEWTSVLQTGDIVNGRSGSNGHVWTYLGKNNSNQTMVLTQDISRVSANFSKYQPGEHFTMQASGYAMNVGGNKMGLGPMSAKKGRDSSGKAYHAMRPIYNIKK